MSDMLAPIVWLPLSGILFQKLNNLNFYPPDLKGKLIDIISDRMQLAVNLMEKSCEYNPSKCIVSFYEKEGGITSEQSYNSVNRFTE